MAVGAWVTYDRFHEYMGDGTIDMDAANEFNIHLFDSGSNAATGTLSTLSQISGELTSANGYTLSGKVIASHTWASGASAGETRLDSPAGVVWTASGGNLGNVTDVKYAVIVANVGSAKDGTNKIVAVSTLSTSGFVVATGNTLTINPNATNGYLELNRV